MKPRRSSRAVPTLGRECLAAFWEVANYREAYGLFACSGILFNHESPLRPERFVTQKIVASARRIASGEQREKFAVDIEVKRDWGWAPEFVEAMWSMLQQDRPDDYVIATGETRPLADFVPGRRSTRSDSIGASTWKPTSASCARPIEVGLGNPEKASAPARLVGGNLRMDARWFARWSPEPS